MFRSERGLCPRNRIPGGGSEGGRSSSPSFLEPVLVLDDLPVGIFVEDALAAKLVDVAALVVELLAVRAGTRDHPDRHCAASRHEVLDVIPAHVADDLEAIGEHLPDGRLAMHAPAGGLGTAGHEKGGVVLKEAHDAVYVAVVEGRVDLEQYLDAGAGRRLDHGAL